jgi:hypothetical protein
MNQKRYKLPPAIREYFRIKMREHREREKKRLLELEGKKEKEHGAN